MIESAIPIGAFFGIVIVNLFDQAKELGPEQVANTIMRCCAIILRFKGILLAEVAMRK